MSEQTILVVVQVVALVLAVSFHESAHGLVALACGDPTARDLGRISLNPLRHIDPVGSLLLPALLAFAGAPVFGWAKPVPVMLARTRAPRRAHFLISAAGPVSNLLLAGCSAAAVAWLRPQLEDGGLVLHLALSLAVFSVVVNVVLAVFNLLPIPPLDGFGVLESLLPRSLAPLAAFLRRFGMAILLLAIFTGALRSVLAPAQRLVLGWLLGRG
ncbi:MAG TPA: site-2 protease family protein [Candidatus Binatia bacterium]|nr:site-2 protease family protein [Candidatus Binatia bacterium]